MKRVTILLISIFVFCVIVYGNEKSSPVLVPQISGRGGTHDFSIAGKERT
jgi:hypothetical protein